MLFVDNQGNTRPQINLAVEEYLLRNILPEEDLLFVYINEPSIIVGRFQNTLEEVNQAYVEEHGIHVVRRLSGGGAVYHDLNNLNFSFITPKDPESISNFKKINAPIIRALGEMGVTAELGSRNEILVNGLKISGNAQYITGNRMISHGTLLFNSDLTRLGKSLHVQPGRITSKGTKSIRSQVTNIIDHLPEPLEMAAFRARIIRGIFAGAHPLPQYHLIGSDWQAIHQLAQERYLRWEWNYGSSPDFTVQKTSRFSIGDIHIRLEVHQGLIRSMRIQGDAWGDGRQSALESCLLGVRYDRRHLRDALENSRRLLNSPPLTVDDWISLLY
jgi:lipoate---protein ligase